MCVYHKENIITTIHARCLSVSVCLQSFPTQAFIKYSLPKAPGRKSVEIVSEQTLRLISLVLTLLEILTYML